METGQGVQAAVSAIEGGHKRSGGDMSGMGTSPTPKRLLGGDKDDLDANMGSENSEDKGTGGANGSNKGPEGSDFPFDLKKFGELMKPFMTEACKEAVDSRFKAVEGRVAHVESFEPRIEFLEKKFQEASLGQNSATDGSFHPGFVEFKVCEWDDRREKGVDRNKAERFVAQVRDVLPEALKPHFKEMSLGGYLNHKIKVATTPTYTHEIRGNLEELMKQHGFTINDTTPRILLERPPEIQAMYKLFGKLADLSRAAVAGKPELKLDIQPQWAAVFLRVEGNEHPSLIGEIIKNSDEMALNEKCLKDHLSMSKEQFLGQSRRR